MQVVQQTEKGLLFRCYISPGAKKNEVAGLYNSRLKIKVKAAPVDGKANKEFLKFFSKLLRVKSSSLFLIRGESSRNKDVLCEGLSCEFMGKSDNEILSILQNAR